MTIRLLYTALYTAALLALVAQTPNAHSATRHKGLLGGTNQPPTKKPPTTKGGRKAPGGSIEEHEENSQTLSEDTLYSQPSEGKCAFTMQSGFESWSILQAVPGTQNRVWMVGHSQSRRDGGTLLKLDIATGKIEKPIGDGPWISRIYPNRTTGDLVAVSRTQGLFVYSSKRDQWSPILVDRVFYGFAWASPTTAYSIMPKQGKFLLTHIDLAKSETADLQFTSDAPATVTDADGKRALILKFSNEGKGEILLWDKKGVASISENPQPRAALFTADYRNILSVEDVDGEGGSVWVRPIESPKNGRPFSAEKAPVWNIALSPDRRTLAMGTHKWGRKQAKLIHIDGKGTPLAQWDQEIDPHESITLYPANFDGRNPMALAVLASPEKQDALQSVQGNTRKIIWAQKEFQCLATWRRLPLVADDQLPFVVDIYLPHGPVTKRKIVYFIPHDATTPHEPDFSAVRHYWLQNGWTVLEPHLRGSFERGTRFFQAASTGNWWKDIDVVRKLATKILPGTLELEVAITESSPDRLGAGKNPGMPLIYTCNSKGTDGSHCSSQELARLLLQ